MEDFDIQKVLEQIIDGDHPRFTPITDEKQIDANSTVASFTRDFLHDTGKKFRMVWDVHFHSDEKLVKTVFHPAITLET